MKKFVTSVMILALAAGPISAQTPPGPLPREAAFLETISVTGVGRVSSVPDRVSFTVGVDTIALTVPDAVNENNSKSSRIIAALKKEGAVDKEIRTSNFSISPQYEYVENRRPRIIGYQVSNNVTLTRDNTKDVGRLLQAAIDAGANQVHGISFLVADTSKAQADGLKSAFADARAKADVLARSAGRTVGRAISITEGSAPMPPQPYYGKVAMMEARTQGDMAVPVEQGTEELRFTVSVIFELD